MNQRGQMKMKPKRQKKKKRKRKRQNWNRGQTLKFTWEKYGSDRKISENEEEKLFACANWKYGKVNEGSGREGEINVKEIGNM